MHKNRVDCCGLPDVRYAPDSDQIPQRSEMTLCANIGHWALLFDHLVGAGQKRGVEW
jgi:hypothetical protein